MVEQSYKELPYRMEGEALRERDMNLYWSSGEPILVSFVTYIRVVAPRRDKSCGRVADKFGLRTWL